MLLLAFYVGLTSIDWPGRYELAVANSRWLFDLERVLHIDIEPALNSWLAPRGALRTLANYEYAITYLVSSFVLLVWLYFRQPATYRWARTSFIALNVVSLLCFLVYPVAPPRMLPDLGFTDTIVLDRTWGSWGSPMTEHANQLAAMPSLHIGWALWVSLILATISSHWLSQAVSGVHVFMTLLVIMATANHYLIDAVGGAVVAVASVAVTRPRADSSATSVTRTLAPVHHPLWIVPAGHHPRSSVATEDRLPLMPSGQGRRPLLASVQRRQPPMPPASIPRSRSPPTLHPLRVRRRLNHPQWSVPSCSR
jgi:hypothetical protein